MDDKQNPFAGLHTGLSLKIKLKAAMGMKTSIIFFMTFIGNQLNISNILFRY